MRVPVCSFGAARALCGAIVLSIAGVPQPAVPEPVPAKHILWRVERPDGGIMYLLGSLHFSDESLYPLPDAIIEAYRKSATVVFEVDMGELTKPGFAGKLMKHSMYENGDRSLRDDLSTETFALLEQTLSASGFSVDHFLRFKPWYCANFLMTASLRKAGLNPTLGLDQHFYRLAKADGKRVVGLETVDRQLGLLSGLSPEEGDAFLKQALTELSDIQSFSKKLVALWREGDVDGLATVVLDGFEGADDLYETIILARNRAWIKQLLGLKSGEGGLFVVVGAGHLVGSDGLVTLLRDKGWSVERL